MNTPVYQFETSSIETLASESTTRQPVLENIFEGIHFGPVVAIGVAVGALVVAVIHYKNKPGSWSDVLEDKPYEQ